MRRNYIPTRVEHRIEARYPALAYGPTWLPSGLRYIGHSGPVPGGQADWSANFDASTRYTTRREMSWEVGLLSPSQCSEMAGYTMATFELNGATVYWWSSNGEQTASKCITRNGMLIDIAARASLPGGNHAYQLAKAVAYAARFAPAG